MHPKRYFVTEKDTPNLHKKKIDSKSKYITDTYRLNIVAANETQGRKSIQAGSTIVTKKEHVLIIP